MTTILHLGVNDLPYSGKLAATVADHFAALQRGKPLSKSAARGSMTTGEVAEILEARYNVMQVFFDSRADKVGQAFASAMKGAVESVMQGAPPQADVFAQATGDLEIAFKDFLANSGIEWLGVPGVPTMAALKGVNHRLKHPYAKTNPRRPSFIDTGLYSSSFAAWVTQK